MARFDEALAEIQDRYGVPQDLIDGIKSASPIRQELADERTKREAAEARADKLRAAALKGQFAKYESAANLNPKALAIPSDLDETDDEAVKNWLVEAGVVPAAPAVPNEEFEQHERVAAAAQGGQALTAPGVLTPAQAAEWPPDKWARFQKDQPEAAEQLKRGQEVHGVVA